MLRRKFPLAIAMLSAWSVNNDCHPGQASEAYLLWQRSRKQWVRTEGERAMVFPDTDYELIWEERRRKEQGWAPLLFSWLQRSSHFLLIEPKLNVKWNQGEQLRGTGENLIYCPLHSPSNLHRPQPTCYGICYELSCTPTHLPPKKMLNS